MRAKKYINMEETTKLKAEEAQQRKKSSPCRDKRIKKEAPTPRVGRYAEYTPLAVSLSEVYREVHQTE